MILKEALRLKELKENKVSLGDYIVNKTELEEIVGQAQYAQAYLKNVLKDVMGSNTRYDVKEVEKGLNNILKVMVKIYEDNED